MGYFTDISNSEYSAKDTALQNRMNGVTGHNPWAIFCLDATFQLKNFFTEMSSNSNANVKEENADENWASNSLNSIKEYNKLYKKYNDNPNEANWNKVESYYNEHKNDNSSIKLPQKKHTIS